MNFPQFEKGPLLYLPRKSATHETKPDFLNTVGIVIGWSDIREATPTWVAVAERLSQYPLEQLLPLLSRLTLWLAKTSDWKTGKQQAELAHTFFSRHAILKDIDLAIRSAILNKGASSAIVFHERLILNAVKACFLITPKTDKPNEDLLPLGEALLMINSLTEDGSKLYEAQDLAAYVTALALEGSGGRLLYKMARCHYLYLTEHRDLERLPEYMSIRERLSKTTGLDLESFSASLYGVQSYWSKLNPEGIKNNVDVFAPSGYFEKIGTPQVDAKLLISPVVTTAPRLEEQVRSRYSFENFKPFDFVPLLRTPVVEHNGYLHCLSAKELENKTANGLYHYFIDTSKVRKRKDADRFVNRYTNYLGRVFEKYVSELLLYAYTESTVIQNRLHNVDAIAANRTKKQVCDFTLLFQDSLVLIEVKSKQFPQEVRQGRSIKPVIDLLRHGAQQIDDTIGRIKAGEFTNVGISPDCGVIYPIVLLLDDNPISPMLGGMLERELANRNLLSDSFVAPLQIMDVGELETATAAISQKGARLDQLLWRKTRTAELRDFSFTNYWHFHERWWFDFENELLQHHFDKAFEGILRWFEERGLGELKQ